MKNKKLDLFNKLVIHTNTNRAVINEENNSRQAFYQLKKRLQEDLYTFLMVQPQFKNNDQQLFLEMNCHKKLYCFKILIDKGIESHAQQILDKVIEDSIKHQLHGIYLEAVSLKNIYFPLKYQDVKRKSNANIQINKLEKSIHYSFYLNQYLSASITNFHDNDEGFRALLKKEFYNSGMIENEYLIDNLKHINDLFFRRDFHTAYIKLLEITTGPLGNNHLSSLKVLGIIYIELAKSCICLGNICEAENWIQKAESIFSDYPCFLCIVLEVKFILYFRSSDIEKVQSVLKESEEINKINEFSCLKAKWLVYTLFLSFLSLDYKKVIKVVNSDIGAIIKNKSWLIVTKILELLSIYQLNDTDWFYYKVESLRKIMNGEAKKYKRLNQIIRVMQNDLFKSSLSSGEIANKILHIETRFPWHPLGNELINFSNCLLQFLEINRVVSVSDTK